MNLEQRHPVVGELALLRMAAGLIQQDVADELGLDVRTVSSWETGIRQPKLSHLTAYARLLKLQLTLSPAEQTGDTE